MNLDELPVEQAVLARELPHGSRIPLHSSPFPQSLFVFTFGAHTQGSLMMFASRLAFAWMLMVPVLPCTAQPEASSGPQWTTSIAHSDADEIRAVAIRQGDTWSRHDAKAYAALFTSDCDVINVVGWHWKGRAELESKLTAGFAQVFAHSQLTITDVELRFLSPTIAVAHARWTMTGARMPPGVPEPRQGIQTLVFTKEGGRWLIDAFQNTNGTPERPFPTLQGDTTRSSSLPRGTPEAQGISSSAILGFIRAADSTIDAMNSVMIVRHGHVVAEGWWAPYDARTPHMLYSLSKSFTSTAVGFAVAENKLSLDDLVLSFFPDEAPADPSENLRRMRVRDLLRMNTGQESEPSLFVAADSTLRGASWVKRFLAHPVPFKPGTHFLYNSPATYMQSAIVQKTTGQTVLDYLGPRLFQPLGIEQPTWMASPQGISAGAYGLNVRTEDIAKLGLLYLQHGMWNGRQLLPAGWAEEATARQTSNGSSPTSDWDQGYGYQFWRSRHGFRGDGAFGQYMLVLPEHDAVVAITSGVRDMQAVMNLVWDKLLPAMSPNALADDPAARSALQAQLGGLRVHAPSGRTTSPIARRVSGHWYGLTDNSRGIRALSLDLSPSAPALVVRTAAGDTRTPLGLGTWTRSRAGFANGIEHLLSAPASPSVALSGAWASDSVFTIKIVAPETPFYSTMVFRFDGDRLAVAEEYNVNFGATALPTLEGRLLRNP